MHQALRAAVSLLVAAAMSAAAASAESASLVADINAAGVVTSFPWQGPTQFLAVGGKMVFVAYELSTGDELWGTDGTPQGTQLLRDLCPGSCSSAPRLLGTAGGVAFLFSRASSTDELWRTDGTPAGTVRLATALHTYPQTAYAEVAFTPHALLFTGCDLETGCEPWTSDGTVAGTHRIVDLNPDGFSSYPHELRVMGDRVYFVASTEAGSGLWRSDGTAAGTSLVHGLAPFTPNTVHLTPAGDRIFFVAPNDGMELWASDGTPAGTRALTSFAAANPQFSAFEASGAIVHFVVDDVVGGSDLWRSDGTSAGTHRVTNFGFAQPFGGLPFDFQFAVSHMEHIGGHLVFVATDGLTGHRLWVSDGTPATTRPLGDCPHTCTGAFESITLWRVGERVLYLTFDGADTALWSSDGTPAGTHEVKEICPGSCVPSRGGATTAGGAFYFISFAYGPENVTHLWRSDGTPAGTRILLELSRGDFGTIGGLEVAASGAGTFFATADVFGNQLWKAGASAAELIADFPPGAPSSNPTALQPFGDELLFSACDGTDQGLWASGGTAASTHELPGPWGGCGSENELDAPTTVGSLAFFVRRHSTTGERQLWRTDGTGTGTVEVASFAAQGLGPLVAHQGKLSFAVSSSDRVALWSSDGTAAGTQELVSLPAAVKRVDNLTSTGGELYFTAAENEYGSGAQVWRTDGTPAGTRQVTELGFSANHAPPTFTRLGSAVYFLASTDPWAGAELWRTGGTAASTVRVVPHTSLSPADDAQALVAFQGKLYFFGNSGSGDNRRALWRSDGTAAGTEAIAAIAPIFDYVRWRAEIAVGEGALFFAADDGQHGNEVWTSDGTAAGTRMVRDVVPGVGSSFPSGLTAVGGTLFFSAHDGEHGAELWQSDGTAAGTRMVQDVAPGAISSQPEGFTAVGGRLFFSADDGVWGRELWALPLAANGCEPGPATLCLGGGRYKVEAHWRDFSAHQGAGTGVALTADTGYFWFFGPDNVEVIVKVLDGRGVNGHVWVFYGALSNVGYTLTVTDTATGAARRYVNPSGRLSSVADTSAFGPNGATPSTITFGPPAKHWPSPAPAARHSAAAIAPCLPGPTRACLNGGRFAVEARWSIPGSSGAGRTVQLTADTGYLWFFGADNVELVVKVLDGRPVNGKFWVFYGALSDVDYTLTVTDTETGAVKEYRNPAGRLASAADTAAF